MAENKKSFLFYCDWQQTFEALPNEKAGELIKHLLKYVNDENPESDDVLINAVFANIKQTLKRDLKKWESKSQKNSENAKKRWDANACERITSDANVKIEMPIDANHADRDKVIVTVIDKDILLKKETKKEISKKHSIDLFPFQEDFREVWDNWIQYKKTEHKKSFKRIETEQAAFKLLLEKSKGDSLIAEKIIQQSIANNWQGLFELKTETNADKPTKADQREQAIRDYLNR